MVEPKVFDSQPPRAGAGKAKARGTLHAVVGKPGRPVFRRPRPKTVQDRVAPFPATARMMGGSKSFGPPFRHVLQWKGVVVGERVQGGLVSGPLGPRSPIRISAPRVGRQDAAQTPSDEHDAAPATRTSPSTRDDRHDETQLAGESGRHPVGRGSRRAVARRARCAIKESADVKVPAHSRSSRMTRSTSSPA